MFPKNSRILFQGDSITDYSRSRDELKPNLGLGNGHPMMIAAELLAEFPNMNYKFYNRGISGDRIVDLYARWKKDAINLKPDYISILVGINDIREEYLNNDGVDAERFNMVYRMLLDWTLKELPNCKFIICEPFMSVYGGAITKEEHWPDLRERQNIVKQISDDYSAIFVPFQSIFNEAIKQTSAEHWFFDGVHPIHAGYGLIKKNWMDIVKKTLQA